MCTNYKTAMNKKKVIILILFMVSILPSGCKQKKIIKTRSYSTYIIPDIYIWYISAKQTQDQGKIIRFLKKLRKRCKPQMSF